MIDVGGSIMSIIKKYVKGFVLTNVFYIKNIFLWVYAAMLTLIRKDGYVITESKLQKIKEIAHKAYDNIDYYIYDECKDIKTLVKQLRAFGAGQIYALVGENWYLILIRYFSYYVLYDFASEKRRMTNILPALREVCRIVKNKKIAMSCREATSYRLVKALAARNRLLIIEEKKKEQLGENWFFMWIRINPSKHHL